MGVDPLFYAFGLGIGEMRVVASLKWCPISEITVYSGSAGEGFEYLVLYTCIKKVG